MRIHALLLLAALFCAPLAADSLLSPRFRTVYVLEMANGLDQHLANHLTASRAMWVVLDPAAADAVLTESLDDTFWSWLARNYPPAPGKPQSGGSGSASRREPSANPRHPGMVFLVDPRTRVVIWSTWDRPKNSSPAELENSAAQIAKQLKTAFEKK